MTPVGQRRRSSLKRVFHMNCSFHLITATTATLLACSAVAQENVSTRQIAGNHSQTNRSWQSQPKAFGATAKASDILGITVNNYQEEKLGKVEEIGVDLESGRILQVILSTGGVFGVGSRLTAVPPTALHYDATQKVVHLQSDKEKLKAAPEFDNNRWSEHSDQTHLTAAYKHHGRENELGYIHRDGVVMDQSRTNRSFQSRQLQSGANDPTQRSQFGNGNDLNRRSQVGNANGPTRRQQGATEDDRTGRLDTGNVNDPVRGSQVGNANDPTRRPQYRNADGTWNRNDLAVGDRSMLPAARLAHVQKASELVGMSVKNHQDETLGEVQNLLLDLSSGRVVAVVISTGGFLGMNGELSAVPPVALGFTDDRRGLRLDTTKEALANAPHFSGNQWPDFNKADYTANVHRAYQVEPYFTDTGAVDADNTGRNERDRDGRSLTPFNQGNSSSDIDITARIRKDVTAGKGLSTNARNVKIITKDGQVTLRGPVASAEEKRVLGEIADRIAGAGRVDNQLEITQTSVRN